MTEPTPPNPDAPNPTAAEPASEPATEPGSVTSPWRPLSIIAIVGRPNVGKSTLLNALAGSRIAIVEETPGVTRDRVGVLCTVADRAVEVVDTGGVGIVDAQGLSEYVEAQILAALDPAAAILFVVDARRDLEPLDERVAQMLRRHSDKVILVANKVESERIEWQTGGLVNLGYGEPVCISAKERMNFEALEERLDPLLPDTPGVDVRQAPPDMQLALVGRVNAGKSTFVNRLMGDDRMIVSEVPGTTRDSVDLRFERSGKSFVVVDTAGIRKEQKVSGSLDFYAQRRAEKAMRRSDVTGLVLDCTTDVARLDRQIADYALQHYHPVVVIVNKWDLRTQGVKPAKFLKYLEETLPLLRHAPVVFTSAVTGRNVERVLEIAWGLYEQVKVRVSTADVNKILEAAYDRRKPRPKQGRIGKIYYGSQVDVEPPTFMVYVNYRYLFPPSYLRFLENRFRAATPMREVPIRIHLKERERSASKNK